MHKATEPAVLTHLEKTLSDNYRKEIDQEENVWRTLPFFAATLALQLNVLTSAIVRVPTAPAWEAAFANGCILVSIGCTLLALGFVTAAVFPARFRYVSQDDQTLAYAESLVQWEARFIAAGYPVTKDALHHLKQELATQYALSSSNNRLINKARERHRAIAGLFTVLAVCSTVVLVAMVKLA